MDNHIEKVMQVLALVVIGGLLAAGFGAVVFALMRKAEIVLKVWAMMQNIGGSVGGVVNKLPGVLDKLPGGIGNIIGGSIGRWF